MDHARQWRPQPGSQGYNYQESRNGHRPARAGDEEEAEEETFNILPLHDMLADNDIIRFPEVRAARAALQGVEGLARPKGWRQGMDLLDWLALLFGFQSGSVKNQREHMVMLLANYQMRMQPPPDPIDRMDVKMVEKLRKKVLKNYLNWCSFLGMASNLWLSRGSDDQEQRQLLYIGLYFLIWGEAANLRFMPECICFLFHNMAGEMNKVLEHKLDNTASPEFMPSYTGENAFLLKVVTPLYNLVKAEAEASHHGAKHHSVWRNYDDLNEFFWSHRCFTQLSWPMNPTCSFMSPPSSKNTRRKVGKTGFVEQRSFWNVYRSFDHLWTGHILILQAMIILSFHNNKKTPWDLLAERDAQARTLSIFITWAGLRVLQSVLDMVMQFRLISVETILIGVRMLAKMIVASIWTVLFAVLYVKAWQIRHDVGSWSGDANSAFRRLILAAAIFILPEVLALTFFLLPWVRNFIERSNSKISRALTWWFQSRCFVGRGLREGLWDNIKYTLFWLIVLLTKFSFSYFLQIKPLVDPTRQLLALRNIDYSWYEFWGQGSNRVAVFVLWAPVVLVYLMDVQIWYTVFSSFAGSLVGLLEHIGEIRNFEQVKLRFPFFASAVDFNLTPEESLLHINQWGSWFKNFKQRIKIRYGIGAGYRKMSADSLEAERFSFIWNSIITNFREEDILSDLEVQLLEVPSPAWNINVTQWPCILLSNELSLALEQVKKWQGFDDKQLWRKITKFEYRRCAVLECYQSTRHVLQRIIREDSEERYRVDRIFTGIQSSLESGTFLQNYVLREVPLVHKLVLDLVRILLDKKNEPKDMLPKVVRALQNLYEAVDRDLRSENQAKESHRGSGSEAELLFTKAVELPDPGDAAFFRQLKRFHTLLATQNTMSEVPKNLEARRRFAFFGNSLFMNMPHAPPVERMLGFSVLTPYYEETVLYSKASLLKKTKDGLSVISYLQQIFPDEWTNFKERMRRERGAKHDHELWNLDKAMELRLWASYRGQTLARTVRGMMYYHKALKVLAYLDGASQMEMQEGRELLAASTIRSSEAAADQSLPYSSSHHWVLNRTRSGISGLLKEAQQEAVASMKFTYIVTCQVYGQQKAKKNPIADDILFLMKKNKALRISYVDDVSTNDRPKQHFSVLVKYDSLLEKEVEIFRVQLPGPVKLGEGKPENQNHALIFTRGDALQTIDMNQDNYFEETLKARNLLQEFTLQHGLRRPQILGVREHVFTGTVSSLASFMSAQETSFVTLGQRVLANPLKVRMHYGHPDVFDRLWFATRGGISKASSKINVSEDIYAGFNCTLRGGNVTHHEYIQAGKGRDLGLSQIAIFESKVAGGNGEQVLSRDIYRLGHHLDFFRMLSFYYTTVGFFISNMMVVLTVYAFLWGRVYLALSGLEKSVASQSAFTNRALTASLNQQFIVQLGIFTALPMIVENSIEHGFKSAVWDFLVMQLQLASVFFTFSLGTRAHYFGRTVLHGGAGYRATGRGFVLKHEKFYRTYMLFARSHFVKGVELIVLLVIYQTFGAAGAASTTAYILITFSSWFLALSWVLGPFLFNTLGFDSLKLSKDFDDFWDWMWDKKAIKYKDPKQEEEETWEKYNANPKKGWHIWWDKEHEHLKNTGFWGAVLEIALSLRFLFLQYGVVYQLNIAGQQKSILVYILSWVYMAVVAVIYMILYFAAEKFAVKKDLYYRLVQALTAVFIVVVIIILVTKTSFEIGDALLSLLAFLPAGWGLLSIALVFRRFLEPTPLWQVLVSMARLFDLSIGVLVFVPLVVLSWIPGFQDMQNRILFNQAFSRGLNIARLLAANKPENQEDSDKKQ